MVDAARLPNPIGIKLAALVKILSEIDPSQKTVIQEGTSPRACPAPARRRSGACGGSTTASASPPPSSARSSSSAILDAATAPQRINNLMLPAWMEEELPAPSSRTPAWCSSAARRARARRRTLYSVVRSLDLEQRNVVTIEDPVEIQIEGVTQLPVDEEKGKGFADLLRTVLRQDPDVILVGEIRDAETARIAMQASITGHLVFSTRPHEGHVRHRLPPARPGVEPYLLTQALAARARPAARPPALPVLQEGRPAHRPAARAHGPRSPRA